MNIDSVTTASQVRVFTTGHPLERYRFPNIAQRKVAPGTKGPIAMPGVQAGLEVHRVALSPSVPRLMAPVNPMSSLADAREPNSFGGASCGVLPSNAPSLRLSQTLPVNQGM